MSSPVAPQTADRARLDRLLVFNLATDADDPILGFTTEWLRALAERVGEVDVVTMRAGRLAVPDNVRVRSVGKERGFSEPRRALELSRILRGLLREHRYDACFAHMMPLFAVLGALRLRRAGVPITLWYTHSSTPPLLRLAERLVDRVVTSTPGSFRLPSSKLEVIGHGVDTRWFHPGPGAGDTARPRGGRPPALVAVGRVAPVKRVDAMVEVLAELDRLLPGPGAVLRLAGPIEERDRSYADAVVARARALGIGERVELLGPVPREDLPVLLRDADVALNLSPGGAFDKAALEAMATGVPVVTTNPSLQAVAERADERLVPATDSVRAVAATCRWLLELDRAERERIGLALRQIVVEEHALDRLADRLVALLAEPRHRREPRSGREAIAARLRRRPFAERGSAERGGAGR